MTKFYIKTLTVFVILLTFITSSNSQCVVCVDAPALITCGETATLFGDGYLTSAYSDDFNTGIGPLWASVTAGASTTSNCTNGASGGTVNCAGGGVVPAGDFLWFNPGAWTPRQATTIPIPVPAGGTIIFEFKMEAQSAPGCDGPDLLNEGIMIQYNTGAGWIDMPTTIFPFDNRAAAPTLKSEYGAKATNAAS